MDRFNNKLHKKKKTKQKESRILRETSQWISREFVQSTGINKKVTKGKHFYKD